MANIRPFCMPKWGIEMTEGTIAEWMVEEGEAFTRGQTLCLIETAKITNDVDAEFESVLRRRLIGAGDEVHPVGTLLAVFADADASDAEVDAFIADFRPAGTAVAAKPAETAPAAPAPSEPHEIITNRAISPQALALAEREGITLDEIEGSGRHGRITHQDIVQATRPASAPTLRGPVKLSEETASVYASPLARRIASLHGIDLAGIFGTGPRNRIAKADVLALVKPKGVDRAAPFAAADNPPTIVEMDKIRKIVARRVTETKRDVPHFYLRMNVAVDALMSLRKTAKTSQEAYELMRASGTASARELSAAFAKSAADAIAANNGIAPSWVQAQAGAKGFELAVDSAGKTILRAMSDGGSAVDALGQKVRESTADFEKQAAALDAINARYGQSKADRDGKYSRPGEGPNRSVLTKDDMKGVDNTGLDSLLQKRQAGTLSQGDLTTAEGVFKAAAANLDVYQKNSHVFSLEGAKSINDNYNASRALLEQIRGLAVPKAVTPTSATAPATTNTYLVKIDLGNGRTSNVNVASANDAQTLISALQSAKSAAGA